jgi:hypothetical protein
MVCGVVSTAYDHDPEGDITECDWRQDVSFVSCMEFVSLSLLKSKLLSLAALIASLLVTAIDK